MRRAHLIYNKSFRSSIFLGLLLVLGCNKFIIEDLRSPASTAKVAEFKIGVNLSNLAGGSTVVPGVINFNFAAPDEATIQYYHTRGLNLLRLPILWERVQPTLNGPLDPTYLGYVTTVVGYARARNMTVLIDVHNYGTYGANKLGDGTLNGAHLADLWKRLAMFFKNDAGIAGYDLMNEPVNLASPQVWHQAAQAAVTAIREVDTKTTIYVEGYNWASAASWTTYNDDFHITDPSDNIIYSAHTYLDRDTSGTYFDWSVEVAAGVTVNTGSERLKVFTDWLELHNYRGHLGEIGAGNNEVGWNQALDTTLAYAKAHKLEVTYWAGGPQWGDYAFSVEQQSGNKDAKQMAVLTKYSDAASPTNYFLSGPERGSISTLSSNFTVEYRGYLKSSVTITPSDSGAGGTFTPTTVTLSPGFNATATFKYTAAVSATITISTSNNAGWTNPTGVGYSTASDLFLVETATPVNIWSLRRIYSPYIGPALRVRRALDGQEADIYFKANGDFDVPAATSFASSTSLHVVKWYDQSPLHHDAIPVFSDGNSGGGPAVLADQPLLVLNGQNSLPIIRFDGSNRMDATSPLEGLTASTLLSTFKAADANTSRLFSWSFFQDYAFPSSGGWSVSLDSPSSLNLNIDTGGWSNYFGRWVGNTTNGKQTFKDGVMVAQQTTTAASLSLLGRDNMNIGWFRFYPGVTFQGDVSEMVVFNGAASDATLAAFQTSMKAYWGTR